MLNSETCILLPKYILPSLNYYIINHARDSSDANSEICVT